MPTISRFFGVSILMRFRDHLPTHFHVEYAEYAASISIETLDLIAGKLPRRVQVLVLEWAMMHRPELRENWRRARARESLLRIAGLDEEA
jgi:hypothetical protein